MIQWNQLCRFTQNQLHILMMSIFKNIPNWQKLPYYRLGVSSNFSILQYTQNIKQFISVDSPSGAEQNGTNDFVVTCTVVEMFLYNWSSCACFQIQHDWMSLMICACDESCSIVLWIIQMRKVCGWRKKSVSNITPNILCIIFSLLFFYLSVYLLSPSCLCFVYR